MFLFATGWKSFAADSFTVYSNHFILVRVTVRIHPWSTYIHTIHTHSLDGTPAFPTDLILMKAIFQLNLFFFRLNNVFYLIMFRKNVDLAINHSVDQSINQFILFFVCSFVHSSVHTFIHLQ